MLCALQPTAIGTVSLLLKPLSAGLVQTANARTGFAYIPQLMVRSK